ncbi:hypothetical protein LTR27_009743 [Elasticomyces elasticus]|nr:hypothetical protein LTR27_009743 [Elasticomyces elasticus]
MPTFSTRLAYALEVDAGDLVVAIDAEANFRLVADTLLMCNVFGGFAPITTLPRELVDHIEAYLKADKPDATAKRQGEVKKMRECAEGYCTAFDHMSDERKLIRINEVLPERGEDEIDSLEELDPHDLQGMLITCDFDQLETQEHWENVEEWWEIVGEVGSLHCGLFSKHAGFALRYYGLDVVITREGLHEQSRTITYLTLPGGKGDNPTTARNSTFKLDPVDYTYISQDADFVLGRQITVPKEPTGSEKARFGKMITGLALPRWRRCRSDEVQDNLRSSLPKLTMLTHVHVQRCDRMHQGYVQHACEADVGGPTQEK